MPTKVMGDSVATFDQPKPTGRGALLWAPVLKKEREKHLRVKNAWSGLFAVHPFEYFIS